MEVDIRLKEAFRKTLESSQKILLICHTKPDADAIGATLAIDLYLKSLGKMTTSFSVDEISESYYFLPYVYLFKNYFAKIENYDLVIVLDCGDRKITGLNQKYPELFLGQKNLINIDHHISNDNFGSLNIVDTKASSTTHIIYKLLKSLDAKITPDMATLLLAGLYYDTGSFKHDNTNPDTLNTAATLIDLGANINSITKNMFKNHSIPSLKLMGLVFDRIKINKEKIASSIIKETDFQKLNLNSNQLHSAEIMNYLDSIPNIKFSCLLTENAGMIKGSFRTSNEDIDVAKIAKLFNGGGHRKASGFVMKGEIKDVAGKLMIK